MTQARRQATILPPRRAPSPRPGRSGRTRSWRTRGDAVTGWAMVGPSVLLIGLFGLIPVVWVFVLSFEHNDLQTPGQWAVSTTTAN